MAANVETMAWVGDKVKDLPWHMSPERMYGYGGTDPMTAEETIQLAGLDWEVNLRPVCVEGPGGLYHQSPDIFGITRRSDNKILGTCTERYQPIQNSEAFSFLNSVVGELGQLRFVTAGAIDGGRRIWLLAQLIGEGFDLEPLLGDKVKQYLMLSSGHDGKNSLKCKFTSVRIVCQNTLNLALRTGEDGVNIKHVGDITKKVKLAREVLGLATQEAEDFRRISAWLASLRVDTNYVHDFMEAMAPTADKSARGVTRAANVQKELVDLATAGMGTHIPGVRGTRWGLLNAVTEYNTHHRTYRDTKQSGSDTNKFDALFGGGVGEKMNQRALDFLLADAPEAIYKAPKRTVRELELT